MEFIALVSFAALVLSWLALPATAPTGQVVSEQAPSLRGETARAGA